MLVQGLPIGIGIMGKQTSVRSLTTSTPDDDICGQTNLDGMKGAFLASSCLFIIYIFFYNKTIFAQFKMTNSIREKNDYSK